MVRADSSIESRITGMWTDRLGRANFFHWFCKTFRVFFRFVGCVTTEIVVKSRQSRFVGGYENLKFFVFGGTSWMVLFSLIPI
jgi:hypothetical protein